MAASDSSWIDATPHGCKGRPIRWAGLVVGWSLAIMVIGVHHTPAQASAQTCPEHKAFDPKHKPPAACLRSPAQSKLRAIESALSGTGLKLDALIHRGGEGGPFVPAGPLLDGDAQHWDRLNRALAILPLAAPLAGYAVSSGFGRRLDPLNRRRAMHTGIDLLAPLRAPVLATAPGRVVFAGRKGGYGRMVEIDHGLGVHTRYGHLAIIRVHAGQMMVAGQTVGLLGNSGRSTGPHLHYEILVDGKARNPQPFLKAGMSLNGSE